MLDSGIVGGTEPPSPDASVVQADTNSDRSMQLLEYLVASVAAIAAIALAFIR